MFAVLLKVLRTFRSTAFAVYHPGQATMHASGIASCRRLMYCSLQTRDIPHFYILSKEVFRVCSTAQSAAHFSLHGIRRVSSGTSDNARKRHCLLPPSDVLLIANAGYTTFLHFKQGSFSCLQYCSKCCALFAPRHSPCIIRDKRQCTQAALPLAAV